MDSKKNRLRVLVIYVGGTLGMKKNENGALVPRRGYLTEQMSQMKELANPSMPDYDILEYDELLDSSDMVPQDWVKIAKDVQANYFDYAGFVVAHGTDTMHFSACALSFLLYNLAKPVIITGGMVTLAEAFNDARRNLLVSLLFASRTEELCEVCIFSNDVLLRGNRSVKVRHTMSAFDSPNYPNLCTHQADGFRLRTEYILRQPTGPFTINSDMSGKVAMFLLHPDFDEAAFESLLVAPAGGSTGRLLDCIVVELMGVGATDSPTTRSIARVVNLADAAGTLVVATAQDLIGKLQDTEMARMLEVCPSIIFVDDMTTEAAAVKAMYLFGMKKPASEVRHLMCTNIRGEMTKSLSRSRL